MKQEQILVTTEMFKPEGRSVKAEEGYRSLIKRFFGPAGEEFSQLIQGGSTVGNLIEDFRGRIDPYFFNTLSETFDISPSVTPVSFYLDARKVALNVVERSVRRIIPRSGDLFKDEVTTNSPSATDLFYELISSETNSTNPRLKFDLRRHLLLFIIGASLDAKSGNGSIGRDLADLQRLFNEQLYYKGRQGYDEEYFVYAYHDFETNTFLRAGGRIPEPSKEGERLLLHMSRARRIEGVGLVNTTIRQKDLSTATEKALAKADKNKGVINADDVEDHMGIRFVALEGNFGRKPKRKDRVDQRGRVLKKVVEVLQSSKVARYEPDDVVDKDRGQADVRFRRMKIYLDGAKTPLELIIFAEGDYYNQELEVGIRDPETGIYNGRAHELFELKRSAKILPVLFPLDIYGINIQTNLVKRMDETAERLKLQAEPTLAYHPKTTLDQVKVGNI